ncbi:MAG: transporter substrate-binding domain-containing protein [Salinivirgaceae bacterium]|nr:transporter substrate-binding domain-containing protein [Salinivirgaceae bacterium]MDD4746091.1 transporter substrate-binding domain-containing protein [Salinivirgaceae bacterium]MDY0281094.1 transporter substrate-binding domain-containing protein [Salinivirgaceae bacterium]
MKEILKSIRFSKSTLLYGGLLFLGLVIIVLIVVFSNKKASKVHTALSRYEEILARDTLIAVTDHSSISYFSYRGQLMGYHYDMLSIFANQLGVELKVVVSNDIEECFMMLNRGEVDIFASNLTVTRDRAKRVALSRPYGSTRQVLVQRKPEGWERMSQSEIVAGVLRNQTDLVMREVYVQEGTVYQRRLQSLSEEIGDSIIVKTINDFSVEQLITLVSRGEIDFTIADENVAMINQTYHYNLDIITPISFSQNLSWAMALGSDTLKAAVDRWFNSFLSSSLHAVLYNKYFKSNKAITRINSNYISVNSGKLSNYDTYLRASSKIPNWDWRLVASLVYQESRFSPNRVSWAGAFGLMQLMPETAKAFGVSPSSAPALQIRAGCRFLKYLDDYFKEMVPDSAERIKFVLASYNVGHGHLLDARRLAEKYGKNPSIWESNVDSFLLKKSQSEFYLDPVVRNGYCRGDEPFFYVREIMARYDHYKNLVDN